ncbi:MAG: sodium:proton antiporter [Bacteroidota bacterium]|jgi:Na+/H+ antiporter NhaD/arsenite permease-like protein|nr:sodium:proton antiporter [Bacteroidota bacterium]
MSKIIYCSHLILVFLFISFSSFGKADSEKHEAHIYQDQDPLEYKDRIGEVEDTKHEELLEGHMHAPIWTVIPFISLLLMIATGPLFYEHFWHKNYPLIAVALALIVVGYFIFILENVHAPIHALAEYIPFIALLASLYIASGGIAIQVDKRSTPVLNVAILIIGSVISNLIGTTGASMLLIRPYIKLNKGNIKPYHIVFFIFMVSNIGGSLTPIGDPPLFLGFLKGIPFFWTLQHNILPWAFALTFLGIVFYFIDKNSPKENLLAEDEVVYSNKLSILGAKNFLWLGVVIIFVFIDPNVFPWVPYIEYDGQKISFIKEIVWLTVAFSSYAFASKRAIAANDFSFEPIKEVAFIFIGIFGTMMPALEIVGNFAQSEAGATLITHNTLYWGTGLLSGFLDNAPTYLNFLAAAMASQGASISVLHDVSIFASGGFYENSVLDLKAISIAAVFFGALTYIGNGPNFMVKSISEQIGIKMPSFFGYMIRYSIPVLLPLLVIVWLIFFAFEVAR